MLCNPLNFHLARAPLESLAWRTPMGGGAYFAPKGIYIYTPVLDSARSVWFRHFDGRRCTGAMQVCLVLFFNGDIRPLIAAEFSVL